MSHSIIPRLIRKIPSSKSLKDMVMGSKNKNENFSKDYNIRKVSSSQNLKNMITYYKNESENISKNCGWVFK